MVCESPPLPHCGRAGYAVNGPFHLCSQVFFCQIHQLISALDDLNCFRSLIPGHVGHNFAHPTNRRPLLLQLLTFLLTGGYFDFIQVHTASDG